VSDVSTNDEKHEFKAEVAALLKLVTNSLYTNSEIFLRELISNAADALDKARFSALVDDGIRGQGLEPEIRITADQKNGVLVIEDNGIGMTRDEATQNLGTIAHSGTLRFLEEARIQAKEGERPDVNLIGQFGVGFYSAFMVADEVVVETLSAREGAEPVRWTSRGEGEYAIAPANRDQRGTRIELRLKDDANEFLQPHRLRGIVRRYSNYVIHPIKLVVIAAEGDAAGKPTDPEQINAARAIWSRSPSSLDDSDYAEFYKHVMGGFVLPGDEPLTRLHFSMDAPIQFSALLFVPGRAPMDLFAEDRKGLQLFARHVLVMDSTDRLLPQWLRFFRGVVDSEDLPLNVSREMLQEHGSLAAIRRQLTRKAVKALKDTAQTDDYGKLWSEFGAVIKEGLHSDGAHREDILELTRWYSLSKDGLVSLRDYVDGMAEGQTHIYYIAGPDAAMLKHSPHLEALKAKGYDVLLMTDPVDEWVLQSVPDYDGKPFQSATQAEGDPPSDDPGDSETPAPSPIDPLLARAQEILGDRIKQVRASSRLTDSAACLVDSAHGLSKNMERILRMARQQPVVGSAPRILELNPDHVLVARANALASTAPEDARLTTWVELLHDLAGLAEGQVSDPAGTVRRLQAELERVAAAEK